LISNEVIEIINQIIKSRKVVCFEVVEVNPLLDTKGNKMAETAFQVLEQITHYFTYRIIYFYSNIKA
jgi:arginase